MSKRQGVEYEALIKHYEWLQEINKSGYLGCMPNGMLVDRREHPEATPVEKNGLFGIVKPKKLPKKEKNPFEEKAYKRKKGKRKGR